MLHAIISVFNEISYCMVSASLCISWLSCVCRSLSFFLSTASPDNAIFSGLNEPQDSMLKKYFLGFPTGSYGAWTEMIIRLYRLD